MDTLELVTIEPGTHPQVRDRIPLIIEGIAEGKPIHQIASELGVNRQAIWKNLQRVDFAPIVSMLVTDILEEINLIDDPNKRVWSRIQLAKTLYSKKTRGELTVTRHTINEERRTARLELDLLSPDEQRTLIMLQDKMRAPKEVPSNQES